MKAICPMEVGVEKKGQAEPVETEVAVPRPLFIGLPAWAIHLSIKSSRGRQETRAGWWWPHCLVGDLNPILARPRGAILNSSSKLPPRTSLACISGYKATAPSPCHFLSTLEPP